MSSHHHSASAPYCGEPSQSLRSTHNAVAIKNTASEASAGVYLGSSAGFHRYGVRMKQDTIMVVTMDTAAAFFSFDSKFGRPGRRLGNKQEESSSLKFLEFAVSEVEHAASSNSRMRQDVVIRKKS